MKGSLQISIIGCSGRTSCYSNKLFTQSTGEFLNHVIFNLASTVFNVYNLGYITKHQTISVITVKNHQLKGFTTEFRAIIVIQNVAYYIQ